MIKAIIIILCIVALIAAFWHQLVKLFTKITAPKQKEEVNEFTGVKSITEQLILANAEQIRNQSKQVHQHALTRCVKNPKQRKS